MFEIVVIFVCLFFNAILSAIEMAFVTVSRPQLRQMSAKGSSAAQRLLKLKENPERTLSVLQVGITLVGAISAAVGGAGAEESLSPFVASFFKVTEDTAEAISIVLVVLPLTYLSVVIGELVPKSFALRFPVKLALSGAMLLQVLDKIFAPFIFILEISTKSILKLVSKGIKIEALFEHNTSVDLEPLSETNKQYVLNLINIDKKTVHDIYVPWEQVSIVNIADHYRFVLQKIKDSRHTRLPVIQDDKVIGILYSKEFVSEGEVSRLDWTELIRPVVKLNPKIQILAALKILQKANSHLAVVMKDETPIGIVTMEDVFEEVVGDIFDEDDAPAVLLSRNSKVRIMDIGPTKK